MAPSQQKTKAPESQRQSNETHSDTEAKNRATTRASKRDKFFLRAQQKIACAECRRLKIKCDRTIPCETCVKRGCASLCPNGTIPPGDGSRFVLAATDHLTTKVSKLESRIRSLEDALAIAHGADSRDCHPLLSPHLPDVPDLDNEPKLDSLPKEEPAEQLSIAKALGSFHIEGDATVRSQNTSGPAESILDDAKQYSALSAPVSLPDLDPSYLGPEINLCQKSFPFPTPGIPALTVQYMIESFLPPMERAETLCDLFFDHLSWMTSIVSRDQVIGSLIPRIYKQIPGSYGYHDLALMFILVGIGASLNLDDQPYNLEAQHYSILGKAALSLQSVLMEPSLTTVKALHLLSIFYGLSGKEENMEQSYTLLDLAGQVALRIGMHIDPSRFNFTPDEAYERREYFWNLLSGLLLTSLVTGRPPTPLALHIDCNIPTEVEEKQFFRGETPRGFGIWGFQTCLEGVLPVTKAALATDPPEYKAVLELERKIRSMAPPIHGVYHDHTNVSMRLYAHSNYLDQIRLFLHRPFFAQAMSDHTSDPMKSPYAQSVIAAYQSACVVLQTTNAQYVKKPELCARIWRMWSFAFTAAIIVGTLAMRNLSIELDSDPRVQFEAACVMFRSAAGQSARAARALPLLEFMLHKSRETDYSSDQGKPFLKADPIIPGASYIPSSDISVGEFPPLSSQLIFDSTDTSISSFGDIAWQGLFRETSGGSSAYGYRSDLGTIDNTLGLVETPMLDDKWASFMHTSAPHHMYHAQ